MYKKITIDLEKIYNESEFCEQEFVNTIKKIAGENNNIILCGNAPRRIYRLCCDELRLISNEVMYFDDKLYTLKIYKNSNPTKFKFNV